MNPGVALALWQAVVSSAQQVRPDVQVFVTSVRAATERFRDRAAAIADGYRLIGPDFPSMGEHWLSVPLAVRSEIDPLRPPILEYVRIDGRPVLAGVAYIQLVRSSVPKSSLPAPETAWHFHEGTVDEESFVLGHLRESRSNGESGKARIAVLHAWVWLDNPGGLFATDNWALPWHRLGLAPPPATADGPGLSSLSAALASLGDAYFMSVLRAERRFAPRELEAMTEVFGRYRQAFLEQIRSGPAADRLESDLTTGWRRLLADIRGACDGCNLPAALRGSHH